MAIKKATTGLTRAQKTTATKALIKELLAIKPMRHNELIDEVAKLYTQRHEDTDTENPNDVKGRVGSVLDIMKKESEIMYDGGMYALKARLPMPAPEEKAEEKPAEAPKKRTRAKKSATPVGEKSVEVVPAEESAPAQEEKPAPKKRTRAKKVEPTAEPIPAPVQEKSEGKTVEKPAPKKRGRKPKAATKEEPVVVPAPVEKSALAEEKKEEKASAPVPVEAPAKEEKPVVSEKTELVVSPKAEVAQKSVVMDMSFLFGDKALKAVQKPVQEVKSEEKKTPPPAVKTEAPTAKVEAPKTLGKPSAVAPVVKAEKKPVKESKAPAKRAQATARKTAEKPLTAEEKLKDAFLKRMRALGGDYFEYYSVYLLERYCMKNGRRLEGLRISGGDHDGGIDGEIELTDKFGFKETIYIQSKNWDPEKGKEEKWVVGETLLQQFIGACAYRQVKDGKQHSRGIFITTSRFTPDAKRLLDDMSDKLVGYDGNDLFEAAKECSFGIVKKNGEWVLDESLLSGTKAFFQML